MNDAPTTPPSAETASASSAHLAFPPQTPEQIERRQPMGERCTWRDGELLFEAGEAGPGMCIMPHGQVGVTRRDGLGNELPVATQAAGEFLAEVGQLSGKLRQRAHL